jgi:hypothetical protein
MAAEAGGGVINSTCYYIHRDQLINFTFVINKISKADAMKKILLLSFLLAFHYSNGQAKFQKLIHYLTGSEIGQTVRQTSDGGYIITGRVNSSGSNSYDVFLVKTDANGNVTWGKTISTSSADNDYGYSVKQTSDGGYIVCGLTNDPVSHNGNYYLIKTNSAGTVMWTKAFSYLFGIGSYCVEQTSDGGYIMSGNELVIKTNSAGDTLWSKRYYNAGFFPQSLAIHQTQDGGYIVGGQAFVSTINKMWLMKINSSGVPQWSKTYGGAGDDYGYDVCVNSDGGFTITGQTHSFGSGNDDVYVVRTNSTGDTLWTRTYGGTAVDQSFSVQQTPDGGFIVGALTTSFAPAGINGYLLKINGNGSLNWSRTYGDSLSDYMNAAIRTSDGGYIMTGFTYSFGLSGGCDLYLVKTDSLGVSGCHDFPAATLVTSPGTIVTSQTVLYPSAGGIYSHTTTTAGSASVNTLCSTIGVDELQVDEMLFSIYPNPARNTFTILLNEESGIGSWELKIYDVTGRMVHEQTIRNQESEIRNLNLLPGIYLVGVTVGEKVWQQKLVVE